MLIPAAKELITGDALNRLFETTAAELPAVASVQATPLDGGNGYLSQTFRLAIGWACECAGDAPPTLIAKLPLPERLANMTPDAVRMYRREAMFYREVAEAAPLRTPRSWVSEWDESGAAVMVFEDLGDLDSFTDDESTSVERIQRSLVRLSGLHAKYWNSPKLDGMDWLAHPVVSSVDQVSAERFDCMWPQMVASGAYELSTAQLHLGNMLQTKLDGVYEVLHAGPETLIHTDLHQENLFFDGDEPVFIDWALAERASPAKDVAKLTTSCLEPGTAGSEQPELIRQYMDALVAAEIKGVSLDEFSRLTHLATCHYMAILLFLGDRDFSELATNPATRTDFTSSRVLMACDRDEVIAAVEGL